MDDPTPPEPIDAGYRIRLRFAIRKMFNTAELALTSDLDGRELRLAAEDPQTPLKDANRVVMSVRGFATEDEARSFGQQLKQATGLASLAARIGVDLGDDTATTHVNEKWAREVGFLKPGWVMAPNVHGLSVLPDHDRVAVPIMKMEGVVRSDPEQFFSALKQAFASPPSALARSRDDVTILNKALMAQEALSRVVFCLSVVEALGQDEEWSEAQRALLTRLAEAASADETCDVLERAEVADAIRRGTHRIGLRQGVKRLFARLGLSELQKEWDRIYSARSGVFHGTKHMPAPELDQLANDAATLAGRVILALARREGAAVPDIAADRFPS